MKKIIAAIAALGVALGLTIVTVGPADAKRYITGRDIKDTSVKMRDLSVPIQNRIRERAKAGPRGVQGEPGKRGPAGQKGEPGGIWIDYNYIGSPVTIDHIGGPFKTNATLLTGDGQVSPGRYLVHVSGTFDRADNSEGSSPILQVAVRGIDGSTWGADYGTAFTGNYPATGDREQTANYTKVVTVTEPTTVAVYAFGYNNDGSALGSGNYTVRADVTFQRING